ncbi:MAG: transcriptional regulator with GAF, ATPase, and Fis domain, partial [Planctomycetota bacterium]
RLIAAAVEEHHGNWAAAARARDVERSNQHRLALRLGLK